MDNQKSLILGASGVTAVGEQSKGFDSFIGRAFQEMWRKKREVFYWSCYEHEEHLEWTRINEALQHYLEDVGCDSLSEIINIYGFAYTKPPSRTCKVICVVKAKLVDGEYEY